MTILITVKECVGNYVVTCNPAPKTPASEVIVKTVTDLATTGGTDMTGWVVAGILAIATGILFLYNHFTRKERRDDD